MRKLTNSEIESLANRNGADAKAIEHFLSSMGASAEDAIKKLARGLELNNWSLRTVAAIHSGITLASKESANRPDRTQT